MFPIALSMKKGQSRMKCVENYDASADFGFANLSPQPLMKYIFS